ncbi:Inner membrane protein YqaA [Planctomycetes bacterium Poly30]|uniref:Inner membrane protein YqaA n=1 Tax=Saltatorellus ferox TaxID=2528018 RepID=A0A518F103_9BACT|nr:Inner membrane protein YqaA [Planctomycetes bacterium Poly30]
MEALVGLFTAAFLSATLLPGVSEATLAALLLRGHDSFQLWAVATLGNTLGSVVNWGLGRYFLHFQDARWFPFKPERLERASRWFEARGVWTLTLGWVPVIGDALTFIAGVLRTPLWLFVVLVGLGKAVRYAVVVWLLLRVA